MQGVVVQYALSTFAAEITFLSLKRGWDYEEKKATHLFSSLNCSGQHRSPGGEESVRNESDLKRGRFLGSGVFDFTKLGKRNGLLRVMWTW